MRTLRIPIVIALGVFAVALAVYFKNRPKKAQEFQEGTKFTDSEYIVPDLRKYPKSKRLSGLTVVIDPGHGGVDKGTSNKLSKVTLVEDEYAYDTACRLNAMVISAEGLSIMTLRDRSQGLIPLRSIDPLVTFSHDTDEYFSQTGKQVVAGREGLSTRTMVTNTAYGHSKKVVFVSLHFDATSETLYGVSIVAPPGARPKIVDLLEKHFRKLNRLRRKDDRDGEYHPVVVSGDPKNGMRNLYVLNPKYNMVPDRVLIELGNMAHASDRWRVRMADVREEYAAAIFEALCEFNE